MKKIIFFGLMFCLNLSDNNGLFAQYSDASLNGPWFIYKAPLRPLFDSTKYIVFNDNGLVTDASWWGTTGGNDTVTASGAFSGSVVIDLLLERLITFSGQLYSSNAGTISLESENYKISKIDNPGALTDSLVGYIYAQSIGKKNITLQLNNNGVISSATGLTPPVSGVVYADSGIFIGLLKTGPPGVDGVREELLMIGTYENDSLVGTLVLSNNDTTGIVKLVRKGGATGINELGIRNEELGIKVYPNPVNEHTAISYKLSAKSLVDLKVYDLIGKEVSTLVNQEQEKGDYKIEFDAEKLNNGIYFCKLQAGNMSMTRKIVVVH